MVELTWEGKYDADGRRAAPLRVQLPFQTVEMAKVPSSARWPSTCSAQAVFAQERVNGVDHVIELLYYRDKPG